MRRMLRVSGKMAFCFCVGVGLVVGAFLLIGGRTDSALRRSVPSALASAGLSEEELARVAALTPQEAWRELSLSGEWKAPESRLTLPAGFTTTTSGGQMIFAHFGDGEIPGLRQSMVTSFLLTNDSAYEAKGTLAFFRDDGAAETLTIGATTAASFPLTLHPGETRKWVTSGKGTLRSGWALLQTDQPVTGSSAFSLQTTSGRVVSEVGVGESILREEFTLFADTIGSVNTGVAIVNPNPSATLNVDLELHAVNGSLIRTEGLTLPPKGHVARFVPELFKSVAGIQEFEGSLVLKGNHPFGGLTLRTLGGLMTSVPLVPPLDPFDYGSTLRFPHLADGAGSGLKIFTTVLLFNNTPQPAAGQVEFFQSDGTPMAVKIGSQTTASFPVSLGPGAVQRLVTTPTGAIKTGWARVVTDQPLHGAAIFQIQNAAGTPLTEVGVSAGVPQTAFNVLADSTGPNRTGIAVMNPSESDQVAKVTFSLFDKTGSLLAQVTQDLEPLTNSPLFIDQIFKSVPGVDEMEGRLGIAADRPVVGLALRQIDVLTTSVPVVIPLHGFSPKSLLEFPQNLTSSTPSVRWRIEQAGTDLTLESMEISAPALGLNAAALRPGQQIGQGVYVIDLGIVQLGGIIQLVTSGPQTFDVVASGPLVAPGTLLLSGSFAGTASGGMVLRIDPTENRNANWNDGRRLEMDLQLLPGLITTPPAAGGVEIVTRCTSASYKANDTVRITSTSVQPQAFVAQAAAIPQLYSQTPVFATGGRNLKFQGKGYDASVEVGFPTPAGTWWQKPWQATATEMNVDAPPQLIAGEIRVRKGAVQGNSMQLRSLFSPTIQVSQSAGARSASLLSPRFELDGAERQLGLQDFEFRLMGCSRNLATLPIGTVVGSVSVGNGLLDGGTNDYDVVVDDSDPSFAYLKLLEAGGTDIWAYVTLTQGVEEGTSSVTFTFEPASSTDTPVVNAAPAAFVLDLPGVPLTISEGVGAVLWDARIRSVPAQLTGADSGLRVQQMGVVK